MHIFFDNKRFELEQEQTVLSALLDQGYDIPNICRAGACQSCIMQATKGEIPSEAQLGLKETLKLQGYFLACCCKPKTPLHIIDDAKKHEHFSATVIHHTLFNDNILCLRLKPLSTFNYHAGQFITIWKNNKIGRNYSLASVVNTDAYIELHIRRVDKGIVSNWLFDEVKLNDTLQIQAAMGNCFYTPEAPEQTLLLAGTGTGLAPLYGIMRDALQQGHRGEIHLIHGAIQTKDLYMHKTLLDLQSLYKQFHYHASVLQNDNKQCSISTIPIDEQVLNVANNLPKCKIYLCGAPDIVNLMKNKLFLAGASTKNIFADPFIAASN
ncbi:2-polyprenylphenol hydroxylase and related flavodoxin oxidoreductases [hydrothermal vent metagenome]|uniref:2-polyprenylphenol hydroxylase and related flavodoxin oxidoreductases n=1 Tax=hydrothermal vent metagenome TaxID=652676 RepID=A0A3B0WL63_9ZZZZ